MIALGQDQHLYHVHQDSRSPSGWTDMVVLNDRLKFTTVATVKDRNDNVGAVAWLAVEQGYENKANSIKTAENVLSCLVPQFLKFIRAAQIPPPAGPVVRKAYALVTGLSEGAIALLHMWDMWSSLNAAEKARLGLPVPQPRAALVPAAV